MNIKVFICLILQMLLAKVSFGQEQLNSGVFQAIKIDTPVSEYPAFIKVDTITERLKVAIPFIPFRISHVNLTSDIFYEGRIPVKSMAVLCDSLSKITAIYLLFEPSEDILPAIIKRYGKETRYAGFGGGGLKGSSTFVWEGKDLTLICTTVNGRTILTYRKNEEKESDNQHSVSY